MAGVIGTAMMTLSEVVEAKVTGRDPSTVPGQVGASLIGRADDDATIGRLNTPVHWAHGISMGVVRAAIGSTSLSPTSATLAHFASVWAGDALLYRSLEIAPWPTEWPPRELATDLFHKGVYAAVTGATFEYLVSSPSDAARDRSAA
ncbi:MAG TPA: hypothetical protein VHK88_02180 [Aquihabitans sp.]|nr:hypothetical protein [Aquihabitans sp.]